LRPAFFSGGTTMSGRSQKSSLKENASPDKAAKRQEAQQSLRALAPRRERHWKLPQRYELQDLISSGSYGSVREAYDREKQRRVAIKRTPYVFEDLGECARILCDIAILSRLEHESIVRVFDLVTPPCASSVDEVYMVMEVCDTDMKRLLHTNVALDQLHINTLLYNLTLGVNYLHSAGICHMDLRPANCLLNQDCSVKICDFSLACVVGEDLSEPARVLAAPQNLRLQKHSASLGITRSYQAPELLLPYAMYTEAIDVWSVGCIYAELLQMLSVSDFADRRPLFRRQHASSKSGASSHERLQTIFQLLGTPGETEIETLESEDVKNYLRAFGVCDGEGLRSRFPSVAADSLEMLVQLLKFMPEQRITMAEALQHELFANIRDETREVRAKERVKLPFAADQEFDELSLRMQFGKVLQEYHPSCF
jgi:mitogen-activated protein kinase 1/3